MNLLSNTNLAQRVAGYNKHHNKLVLSWKWKRPWNWEWSELLKISKHCKQDAQLSQRDRAAGCVIVFAKSRRLELGDNI